jgi:hypothetical protein
MSHIWKQSELDRIATSEELEISSSERRGPGRRWTPIWVVRVDDGLYIRSLLGRGPIGIAAPRLATSHASGRAGSRTTCF